MSKKVVISSGHGKFVSGATGVINEVTEARRVVPKVAEYLRLTGLEVVEYHEDIAPNKTDNLNNIVRYHNSQTRDLDVSVHFNAYSKTDAPRGVEVLYYSEAAHAAKVSKAISDASGLINRGAKERKDLYFLNGTAKPSMLIEVCFVDSTADVKIYQAKFDGICKAIAEAISGNQIAAPNDEATVTAKTPIMGGALLNAVQLASYLLKTNPTPAINCTVLELAQHYISEGQAEGVRGDVAFCQAIHETGWFRYGGDVLPEQNNFCGLGATNTTPTGKGAWFDTPQLGVRAQIQHLKAYASKDALKNACIDPRFGLVTRGIAANWEGLAGRWAVPGYDAKKYSGIEAACKAGETYGQKILLVHSNAVKNVPEESTQTITLVIGGDILNVPAKNVEGRWVIIMSDGTEVVLRDFFAVLGYTSITWEETSRTIRVTK